MYLIPLYGMSPLSIVHIDMQRAYHDYYGRWVIELHDLDWRQEYVAQVVGLYGGTTI